MRAHALIDVFSEVAVVAKKLKLRRKSILYDRVANVVAFHDFSMCGTIVILMVDR